MRLSMLISIATRVAWRPPVREHNLSLMIRLGAAFTTIEG